MDIARASTEAVWPFAADRPTTLDPSYAENGTTAACLGEIGEVSLSPKRKVDDRWETVAETRRAQVWEARVYFRGYDGERHDLRVRERRRGDAETTALRRVEELLRGDRHLELTCYMPLVAAGEWYLSQISRDDSGLSRRTVADYTATWRRYVVAEDSPVRGLTLEQANDPQRLTSFLRRVADRHGTGASKMTRSTLAGLFRYAVENGVLPTNALRQVRAVHSQRPKESLRDHSRAFTRDERDAVVAYADAQVLDPLTRPNPRTLRKAQALADLTALMAGTGVRIDEARSILWEHFDAASGRLHVDGTKSNTAARTLNLPEWLLVRLARRARSGRRGYMFPSPASHDPSIKWDQSNNAKAMRDLLDGAGFPWAVPHTFRRTVATLLNDSGATIARIADQLGHSDPGLTARVYLGRDFGGDKSDLAEML